MSPKDTISLTVAVLGAVAFLYLCYHLYQLRQNDLISDDAKDAELIEDEWD